MSRTRLMQFLAFSALLALTILIVVSVATTAIYWSNVQKAAASGRRLARYEWPESLVELRRDADERHIDLAQLEVYSGQHDDYYWKCNFTRELLDLMIARWKLSAVNRNDKVVVAVLQDMPSALSSVIGDTDLDYYVSAEYLPGGEWKGHLYCVMNDRMNRVVLVRYYYNF